MPSTLSIIGSHRRHIVFFAQPDRDQVFVIIQQNDAADERHIYMIDFGPVIRPSTLLYGCSSALKTMMSLICKSLILARKT